MLISKKDNFSEWYNFIIKEAQLCDLRYNVKGFIVIMPWAMKTIEKIYSLYCAELEKTNHNPAFFPSLISENNLKAEKEHVEGFVPEVLWVTEAGDKKLEERYALKPTGETAIYPMYALWIKSISDLPLKIYQRGWVWRYETKATKPFIRGREFLWIEAHDVFSSEKECEEQVIEDTKIAQKVIWENLGIPFIMFKRPKWDKFAGAQDTFAADTIMPDGRVLQIASTHLLGQHFSKAFNVRFMNKENEYEYAWQTCYGPGINRIYAALISIHGDDKGLIFPFEMAPIQITIIPIISKGNEEIITAYCEKIYHLLKDKFRIEIDKSEATPGYKFNFWEMKGVPLRFEIGINEVKENSVTVFVRDSGKKTKVKIEEIEKYIELEAQNLNKRLKERAAKEFLEKLDSAKDLDELVKKVNEKKLVKVPFCSDISGEECSKFIKEKYSLDVRGVIFAKFNEDKYNFSGEKPSGEKCIVCGKDATVYVYVGKQY